MRTGCKVVLHLLLQAREDDRKAAGSAPKDLARTVLSIDWGRSCGVGGEGEETEIIQNRDAEEVRRKCSWCCLYLITLLIYKDKDWDQISLNSLKYSVWGSENSIMFLAWAYLRVVISSAFNLSRILPSSSCLLSSSVNLLSSSGDRPDLLVSMRGFVVKDKLMFIISLPSSFAMSSYSLMDYNSLLLSLVLLQMS